MWHLDLEWLMLEEHLSPFANMCDLSYGYWVAYYLMFKRKKLGYAFDVMLNHIDFWINSAFTIWGVYNGDIRFRNLLKKKSEE